jgi:Peptidase family S41
MQRQDDRSATGNAACGAMAKALAAATTWVVLATLASPPAEGSARAEPAVAAPASPATVLQSADLRADAALLREAYESLHPGLYRYRTKAEMDAAFDRLERDYSRDRTLGDAFLSLARFTAYVQCGHTYPNFFNQGDAVRDALLERPRLPFEFRWLDRRMVVTRSYAPELRAGTEVLAIDGRPVAQILADLMPYARADGGNDAKRVSDLEVQGRGRYEAFDVYFPLVHPRDESRPFALEIRAAPGDPARKLQVTAMAAKDRRAVEGTPRGEANPWTYRELEPGVGLLTMPTWAMYNSKFGWEAYLDQLFTEIVASGTRDLIIDLRGNEGGDAVGDRILAHLLAQDAAAEPVERRTRYRTVPATLRPYLDTWDPSFLDWGESAVDAGNGFYRLTKYDNGDVGGAVIKPKAPRFPGRVWVLVGAVNSSATFEFASAVRRERVGTLVGQPTGGNQRGITGGAFFFLRLPRTGLEADLPLIGQFPVTAQPVPDAGIEPDVHVQPRVEDIAAGRDAELAAVMERIIAARKATDGPSASLR